MDETSLKNTKDRLLELGGRLLKSELRSFFIGIGYVLAGTYLLASVVAAWIGPQMIKWFVDPTPLVRLDRSTGGVAGHEQPNYFVLQKDILERNLFNKDGEFPKDDDQKKEDSSGNETIDPNAPCPASKLKITLVGTIAMENPRESVATVREGSYDADVYRIGDRVIGHEDVQVYDIYPRRLVFKNGDGKFECIEQALDPKLLGGNAGYSSPAGKGKSADADDGPKLVVLDSDWVRSEVGDGFANIISSARFVPNADGLGFKLFDIRPGSLFSRAGLQEGDVITQVNSTLLKPDQGFAVYQAFQDETNITLLIRRKGVTPKTLEIKIK